MQSNDVPGTTTRVPRLWQTAGAALAVLASVFTSSTCNAQLTPDRTYYGINRAMGHNQQSDNPFSSHFYTEFARSVRDAVRDGMQSATVTVSQHDAVHAATVARAGAR